MAVLIQDTCGRAVYPRVIRRVVASGRRRGSRNGPTYDLSDVTLELSSPHDALPVGLGRNLNRRIAAAEALQLIGGFSDPEWLVNIAPQFNRYRESDGNFWGAYGPRVGPQLPWTAARLLDDPETRQAVINVWDGRYDTLTGKRDYPCTVAIGYELVGPLLTEPRLRMRVTMRSNDVWLGLPYDMFQFTQLQLTLCNIIGYQPDGYVHTAWSMHLYDHNYERASEVMRQPEPDALSGETIPCGIGREGDTVPDVQLRARRLAYNQRLDDQTESEAWYRMVLHG